MEVFREYTADRPWRARVDSSPASEPGEEVGGESMLEVGGSQRAGTVGVTRHESHGRVAGLATRKHQ